MRTRNDARRDLYVIERQIIANRKLAATTINPKSAAIADATLPSMQRRAAALRAEIETLPEAAALSFAVTNGDFRCLTRTAPFTDAELAALEIPAFLQRRAA